MNDTPLKIEIVRLGKKLFNEAKLVIDSSVKIESIDKYAKELIDNYNIKSYDSLISLQFEYEFVKRDFCREKELMLALAFWAWANNYAPAFNEEISLQALVESHRHLGRLEILNTIAEYKNKEIKSRKDRAKGGVARKQKYNQIYVFFAELLSSERPSEGWKNRTSAINSLTLKMEKYIQNNCSKNEDPLINPENLPTQMRGWFSRHLVVKEAYEKNCRKKQQTIID